MSLDTISWERQLELRAHHVLSNQTPFNPIDVDRSQLNEAYLICTQLTKKHSKTFFMASKLLPFDQRNAARALYAFSRISDDIVDESQGDKLQQLLLWKQEALSDIPNSNNPITVAWHHARTTFRIPKQYGEQLLEGVALDLTKNRFANFQELAHYCYGVASTVGLMTMHIVGFEDEEAIPYAIKLGVALQLTNILRDIGEDWQNGRLYLPQDELAAFALTEEDIENGVIDDRWHAFMRYQIQRTRQLYAEALPGIQMLGQNGRFAIAAAAELYQGILTDIEKHEYDVFTRRAHISGKQKLKQLPGIWYRTKFNQYGRLSNPIDADLVISI